MTRFATPGVYVREQNAFGASGRAVPTAVPAFIGYTAKAAKGTNSVLNTPVKVESLSDFEKIFGGAPSTTYSLKLKDDQGFSLAADKGTLFYLYNSMRLFYANGGGICYVVSVGDYGSPVKKEDLLGDKTEGGLKSLLLEQEPTMVVVPDALLLDAAECYEVYRAVLKHCGWETKSRFGIFDIHDGYKSRTYDNKDVVNHFREAIGENYLGFGAAYYPWLETTIVGKDEVSFRQVSNVNDLVKLLTREAEMRYLGGAAPAAKAPAKKEGEAAAPAPAAGKVVDEKNQKKFADAKAEIEKLKDGNAKASTLDQNLKAISPMYRTVLESMRTEINRMPTAGVMAGLYSLVDNQTGVHKAPANVKVDAAIAPAVAISSDNQEDLNSPINGKDVNAIRSFIGRGVVVWGARTLDGNSQDWRYINVRRTMIMLEQSVKNLMERYVFEPNTSQTWVRIRTGLVNFLTNMWKQGTLVGSSPSQAFDVALGLGATMSAEDVMEGIMRISVRVAISRPAEFIEITFEQKMQEGGAEGGAEAPAEGGAEGGE
jgi:uncharacterized protein